MTKLNITQAAKVAGKDRSTIHRHIKQGKVSFDLDSEGNKVIDAAELIRVYGEIQESATVASNDAKQQYPSLNATEILHQQIRQLERENKAFHEDKDYLKRELEKANEHCRALDNKITRILENQTRLLEYRPENEKTEDHQPKPESRWLVYTLVGLTMLVSLGSIAVIVWLLQNGA